MIVFGWVNGSLRYFRDAEYISGSEKNVSLEIIRLKLV